MIIAGSSVCFIFVTTISVSCVVKGLVLRLMLLRFWLLEKKVHREEVVFFQCRHQKDCKFSLWWGVASFPGSPLAPMKYFVEARGEPGNDARWGTKHCNSKFSQPSGSYSGVWGHASQEKVLCSPKLILIQSERSGIVSHFWGEGAPLPTRLNHVYCVVLLPTCLNCTCMLTSMHN